MTSLDLLVIVFMAVSGASILAICLMFLLKNDLAKKICFYFTAIQGMLLACMNAASTPSSFFGELVIGWVFGVVSVAAILTHICSKNKTVVLIARILAAAAALAGIINTFII